MPPTLADRVVHILTAIETIERALANKKIKDLEDDLMLRLAVERSLEIMCEAARRLPDNVKARQPQIEWQRMVDLGNRLRHAYHRVDPSLLWEIAHRDLPSLKHLPGGLFASRAIEPAQTENDRTNSPVHGAVVLIGINT